MHSCGEYSLHRTGSTTRICAGGSPRLNRIVRPQPSPVRDLGLGLCVLASVVPRCNCLPRVAAESDSDAVRAMVAAYNQGHGRVSALLARLALAYEELAPKGRGVSTELAAALGRPLPTVKLRGTSCGRGAKGS